MKSILEPQIPKGTRDFLPSDMVKRDYVLKKMKSVFVNYGYDAIETPALEYAKTILEKYGDEGAKLTYTFKDHGGRLLALRYDQTVPFARFVAANFHDLPMPFKRYQISPVWRADKPARGRYREFYQCDVDIVGTDSLLAEGEIVRLMADVFQALNFKQFVIKFNSRRLMNNVLSRLDIPRETQVSVIRILDKLEKIGKDDVLQLLKELLSAKTAELLLESVSLTGTNEEKMKWLKKDLPPEISEFLTICNQFGVPQEALVFEPSLARGLDYYTGLVFEASVPGINLGPVCAGGRYDDLCSTFSPEKISGVGVAFGFDRIMLAMEELMMLVGIRLNSQVLVTYFEETLEHSLKIVNDLREAGIASELYFQPDRLSKQMKYADKKGIPFVILCGPDEAAKGEAVIKVMKIGKQKTIPQNQLSLYLMGYHES